MVCMYAHDDDEGEEAGDGACTAQQQADPPYFGIAMIVKNEVGTIAQTLESVRGCVL